MRLVITGTGRSGTGYCAELLEACGVACGHESVFSPPVAMRWRAPDWEGFEADASWLAAAMPHDARTVLVTRHPAAVIRSWLQLGVLEQPSPYLDVIAKVTPTTLDGRSPEDRALRHWFTWTTLTLQSADEIVPVEALWANHLAGWCRHLGHEFDLDTAAAALAIVPRNVNAKAQAKQAWPQLERSMFDPRLLGVADELAGWLGYHNWLP